MNLESLSSTNANTVAVAKITVERGWRVEDHEFVEKVRFGASYGTSNKLLLIARHIMTTGLQKYP